MKREISDETAVTIAKIIYFLIRMLIPLVIGHFFGIVAERIAYGLVICVISLKAIEAFLVLDGIQVMVEKATEELERKMKDCDQTD